MKHRLQQLSSIPVLIMEFYNEVTASELGKLFSESQDFFLHTQGSVGLLIDCTQLAALDHDEFVKTLNTFQRLSYTFKKDAPIYVAVVGEPGLLSRLNQSAVFKRMDVPTFDEPKSALSFLNLKVEGSYIKDSISKKNTETLETFTTIPMKLKTTSNYRRDTDTAVESEPTFSESGMLYLEQVVAKEKMVVLPSESGLSVGRRDQSGSKPDIDLTRWGGYYGGVSRHHARIEVNEDGVLVLIDLASSNGTYINNQRLRPEMPYPLHHGDHVAFGRVEVVVYFEDTLPEI